MKRASEAIADQLIDIVREGDPIDTQRLVEQVSLLLFLRILDREADDTADQAGVYGGRTVQPSLFPDQADRYRWSRWPRGRDRVLHDFVASEVLPYMSSLVREDPQVAAFFRDARLEIRQPSVLARMVDLIHRLELFPLGRDETRELLEDLLSISHESQRQSPMDGEYRTPPYVRRLLIQLVDPAPDDTVCDFACGTGGFLVDIIDHIERTDAVSGRPGYASVSPPLFPQASLQSGLQDSIFGVDISHRMARIATVNLMLHGIRHPQIEWTDSLRDVGSGRHQYSVLLSNPPMGLRVRPEVLRADPGLKSSAGDVHFLMLMLRSLAPGGRGAVIVPPGVLFRSGDAFAETRERLIKEYRLLAIVTLPGGSLGHSIGISPCALVFRRREPQDGQNPVVWFYEIPGAERRDRSGRSSTFTDNTLERFLSDWSTYRDSGFTSPPGSEAGTVLNPDESQPRCWWATADTIAAHGYGLSPTEYRPQITAAEAREDPVDLLRELLRLEAEIGKGLQNLLRDVESPVPTDE